MPARGTRLLPRAGIPAWMGLLLGLLVQATPTGAGSTKQPRLGLPASTFEAALHTTPSPDSVSLATLPFELMGEVVTRLPPDGRARWRTLSRPLQALVPATRVPDLYARTYPRREHQDPFLLYRFCIWEPERLVAPFPNATLPCLRDVDAWFAERWHLPSSPVRPPTTSPDDHTRPTLSNVRVQLVHDLLRRHVDVRRGRATLELVRFLAEGAEGWSEAHQRSFLTALLEFGDAEMAAWAMHHFCHRPAGEPRWLTPEQCVYAYYRLRTAHTIHAGGVLAALPWPQGPAHDAALAQQLALHNRLCDVVPPQALVGHVLELLAAGADVHYLCAEDGELQTGMNVQPGGLEAEEPGAGDGEVDEHDAGPFSPRLPVAERLLAFAHLRLHNTTTHAALVQALTRYGADLNCYDSSGDNYFSAMLLHVLVHWTWVAEHNPAYIRTMLRLGALPRGDDQILDVSLEAIALLDAVEDARLLLRYGYRVDLEDWSVEHTMPLMKAQSAGMVEVMLAFGMDPRTVEQQTGETALHKAVRARSVEVVRALIDRGGLRPADLDARNAEGASAVMLALDVRTLWLLLQRGASLHVRDARGNTLLHRAVLQGADATLVEYLVGWLGMDVHMRNGAGRGPLQLALERKGGLAERERRRVVRVLLRHGARLPSLAAAPSLHRQLRGWERRVARKVG